jgi:hypothetical protein
MAASLRGHEPDESPLLTLPSSAVTTVTENTSLCVIMICNMLCIKEFNKSNYQSKPVYSHTHTRDNMFNSKQFILTSMLQYCDETHFPWMAFGYQH